MSRERSREKAPLDFIEAIKSVGSIKDMLYPKTKDLLALGVVSAWIGDTLEALMHIP